MTRYRTRRYHRSIGLERALAHIEAARRLSIELGGTVKDVREYFFELKPEQLRPVLDEYGIKYGSESREYAEKTISKWRTGRVQMSGLVASRLFALLPPRMPLEAKYRLIADLWKHVGPSSKKTMKVTVDASIESIVEQATKNIREVVTNYKIPSNLEKRFDWLSSGDTTIKQQLLNHFQTLEKELVVNSLRAQLPALVGHLMSSQGTFTRRLAHIVKVGKHELEIVLETGPATGWRPRAAGQMFAGAGADPTSAKSRQSAWVALVIIIAVIFGVSNIASVSQVHVVPIPQPQSGNSTPKQSLTSPLPFASPQSPPLINEAPTPPQSDAERTRAPTHSDILPTQEAPNHSSSANGEAASASHASLVASAEATNGSLDYKRAGEPVLSGHQQRADSQYLSKAPAVVARGPLNLLDRANAIRVQERLRALGYFDGAADGIWGARSRSALRDFRRRKGLGGDDRWDAHTQAALLSEDTTQGSDRPITDAGASKAPSVLPFEGNWTPHPYDCGTGTPTPPVRISQNGAQVMGANCDFADLRHEATGWQAHGVCRSDGRVWEANIHLTAVGGTLVWSDEHGTVTYFRCN